jgi:hypothetical protein
VVTTIEKVMNTQQSFKNYRTGLREANLPALPYLGVHLSDLVFIEEGNSDNGKCEKRRGRGRREERERRGRGERARALKTQAIDDFFIILASSPSCPSSPSPLNTNFENSARRN